MSNAAEYARREDKVSDAREEYQAQRSLNRTSTTCLSVSIIGTVSTITYASLIDSQAALPAVIFIVCFIFTFVSALFRAQISVQKLVSSKKKLRDAEREFRYWSLDNPPT